MKRSLIVLPLIFVSTLSAQIEIREISTAISGVVEKCYQKESIKFDIISYASNFAATDEIITEFARSIQGVSYQVYKINSRNYRHFKINQSAILLFESFRILEMFSNNDEILNIFTWKTLKFLIYYPNASSIEVSKLAFNNMTQFQSFLIKQNSDDYDLMCVTRFSPGNCNKTKVVNINKFVRKSMDWATSDFFPKPQNNFHTCSLSIGVRDTNVFNRFNKDPDTGSYHFKGININLMETIAENLNFKANFIPVSDSNDSWKKVVIDLHLLTQQMTLKVTKSHFATKPFYFGRILVLVPSGEAYTGFEKLFLPFEEEVWSWLIITFATAFITILIVNFMPKSVQNYVFGWDVRTPSLNVWIVFCGLSSNKLPGRNFARFILTNFIIFSLIIRTAYQAKMFQLMQLNINKKGVQNLDEIKKENWPLYCGPSHYDQYDGFKNMVNG